MKRSLTPVFAPLSTMVMQITSATTKVLRTWSTPCSTSTVHDTLLPPGVHGLSMGSRQDNSRMLDPSPTSDSSGSCSVCKFPGSNSPRYFQGWPPGSCLHHRKFALWKACSNHVQPGDVWPTDLLDVIVGVDSGNYTQSYLLR